MSREEIKRKIDRARTYLEELKSVLVLGVEAIIEDKIKLRATERIFQLLVDEAVDTNMLIITDSELENPENYRSTFYTLSRMKIIEPDFADRVSESAKLRNQIVHEYEKIQERTMIEGVKKFVPVYEEYLIKLINWVLK